VNGKKEKEKKKGKIMMMKDEDEIRRESSREIFMISE
jgi:hypothetical protein